MKTILLLLSLLFVSHASWACDEACKRTKVETAKNIKFPSYLNMKYCQSTTNDFLLNARKSLQRYKDTQLPTAHRGGAKNIRNFINQRRDWLQECDNYMRDLELGYVFRQKETSDKVFTTMAKVSDELYKIMMRKKNKEEVINIVIAPAEAQFEELFTLLDDHVIELQKRGLL